MPAALTPEIYWPEAYLLWHRPCRSLQRVGYCLCPPRLCARVSGGRGSPERFRL